MGNEMFTGLGGSATFDFLKFIVYVFTVKKFLFKTNCLRKFNKLKLLNGFPYLLNGNFYKQECIIINNIYAQFIQFNYRFSFAEGTGKSTNGNRCNKN